VPLERVELPTIPVYHSPVLDNKDKVAKVGILHFAEDMVDMAAVVFAMDTAAVLGLDTEAAVFETVVAPGLDRAVVELFETEVVLDMVAVEFESELAVVKEPLLGVVAELEA